MGVKKNHGHLFLKKKKLVANIPSVTHFPSCVAMNEAAAKQNSIKTSWASFEL